MTDIRLEVWDRLGTAGFGKRFGLDTISDSARLQPVNGIGEGRATMPDTFSREAEILVTDPTTPTNNDRAIVRIYLEGDESGNDPPYYEWLINQIIPPAESESGKFEISGLGREAMIQDAFVEPWDWDGEQYFKSDWPDWIYGGVDIIGPVVTTWKPHVINAWIEAGATGNFDIDVSIDGGAFQSATVQPGDSAFDVETALEGLAYGLTVDVEGMGTLASPWQIRILDPSGTYTIAIDSSGLSGGRGYFDLLQYGRLMPVGWTESRVGSTSIPHGQLLEWGASLGTGTDPALPAGCTAWVWFRGTEELFPGVQKKVRVISGGIYTGPPVYLYAKGGSAVVRLVIRDLNENLIAQKEVSLAANTLTLVTGPWTGPYVDGNGLIRIPEGVHEIVYRLGHIGAGTPPDIFMGCPSLTEGFPEDTVGAILGALYTDWTADHAASTYPLSYWVHGDGGFYLALDFSATLDSNSNAWQRDESITIKRGERFDKVLAKIAGLGYEWRVVDGPVDGYYLLQVFNAPAMGTDFSAADTPTIRGGRDLIRRAERRWLAPTSTLVEGADQYFAHHRSTGAQTGWGASGDYQVRLDFEELPTQVAAATRVDEMIRKTRSIVVNLADTGEPTNPIPGRTYRAGDTLRVIDPPDVDQPERVWSINYARSEEAITWEIQFGSQSFTGRAT